MARMIRDGLAARTANKFRDKMLAIWRFLAQRGMLTTWPDVKPAVELRRIPVAWSREQLAKLWAACEAQQGKIGAMSASLWWHSLHTVAGDTGERISGLLSIRRDDVDLDQQWVVIRTEGRKGEGVRTRRAGYIPRRAICCGSFFRRCVGFVFEWPMDRTYLWSRYSALLKDAGLPTDRQHKFHCLRKSVASYFEAAGGSATDALGHSDSRITKRHSLDPHIVTTQSTADLLFRPDAKSLSDTRARDAAGNSIKGTRDRQLAWLVEQWATLTDDIRQSVLAVAGYIDEQKGSEGATA